VNSEDQSVTAYEDKYSLYIAPSIDSWIFTSFSQRAADIQDAPLEKSVAFMAEYEKESLLFYYGLKEILPESAIPAIDDIITQKRDDVLALQSFLKELKADVGDLLLAALNSELMAKRFYQSASAKAQSQAGRKFFSSLADFEQEHFERVKEIIESRDKDVQLGPFEPETAIRVKPEVEGEFEPNKDEIADVLILAIRAEKGAQERYRKLADLIEDPAGKKIFNDFADAEKMHQKVLEDEFYSISNKGTIIWGE
jgi:rubrerythrin